MLGKLYIVLTIIAPVVYLDAAEDQDTSTYGLYSDQLSKFVAPDISTSYNTEGHFLQAFDDGNQWEALMDYGTQGEAVIYYATQGELPAGAEQPETGDFGYIYFKAFNTTTSSSKYLSLLNNDVYYGATIFVWPNVYQSNQRWKVASASTTDTFNLVMERMGTYNLEPHCLTAGTYDAPQYVFSLTPCDIVIGQTQLWSFRNMTGSALNLPF